MMENKRLLSLDTLRGFDMLFISGLVGVLGAICNLLPCGSNCWFMHQMEHAEWNGMFHHDTIFPLFLFIAGISFPFSYAKQVEKGRTRRQIYRKIFYRGFMLAFLGIVYNGLCDLHLDTIRIHSVLGRIGFAWMFAALIFINTKNVRPRLIISSAILIGYWLLLRFVPAPDAPGADPFSFEGNLVGYIDRMLIPNHILIPGKFDNEGLLSVLPAIVTAMLGMLTGDYVKNGTHSGSRKTLNMLLASLLMLGAGLLWGLVFPINKSLWSSSFVLVVGAYSMAMFALFYWIIDVKGWKKWTKFFEVVGLNSIAIYFINRIGMVWGIRWFFFGGIIEHLPESVHELGLELTYFFTAWFIVWVLYKLKIFIKI